MYIPAEPLRLAENSNSVILNETLLEVLSLGPKFHFSDNNIRQFDTGVKFDCLFCKVTKLASLLALDFEKLKSSLVNDVTDTVTVDQRKMDC